MSRAAKWLICGLLFWESRAHAEGEGLTDRDVLELASEETVEVYDERPDKPFDRDTDLRLTGEELAARGATDLATALALIPDVTVRDVGRGGFNVDIRGARKGAVSILVDGVLVGDPYYGTFDVSTIPITDIVQIRVATTPMSPIDGPGGPGGVIEVLTRDAFGEQLVIARASGDSLPAATVSGTARVALARRLSLRISLSGLAGARDMALPGKGEFGERRGQAPGGKRLGCGAGASRVVLDGFLDDRHYVSPPSEDSATILLVDRETTSRVSAKVDTRRGPLQLQAQGWAHYLTRRSRYFRDPALTDMSSFESLRALRMGGMALATRPVGKDARWAVSTSVDRASAEVTTARGVTTGDVVVLAAAGDLQYDRRTLRLDVAAGVSIPLGVGADPWPEAKLVARWKPRFGPFELTATAARKGRVPSRGARCEPNGNPGLGPGDASNGGGGAVVTYGALRIDIAPFYKRTNGTVRASPDPADRGMLVNVGALELYGVDASIEAALPATIEAGASYDHVGGGDSLDRLPQHKADAWIAGRPHPRVRVLARARYTGESIDRSVVVPGYTLVELTATAQLSREYLAVVRVEDLADVRPETRAGYVSAGRVVTVVIQGQWE